MFSGSLSSWVIKIKSKKYPFGLNSLGPVFHVKAYLVAEKGGVYYVELAFHGLTTANGLASTAYEIRSHKITLLGFGTHIHHVHRCIHKLQVSISLY